MAFKYLKYVSSENLEGTITLQEVTQNTNNIAELNETVLCGELVTYNGNVYIGTKKDGSKIIADLALLTKAEG